MHIFMHSWANFNIKLYFMLQACQTPNFDAVFTEPPVDHPYAEFIQQRENETSTVSDGYSSDAESDHDDESLIAGKSAFNLGLFCSD